MNIKEQFAQMMLDKKLAFLPLKESLELLNSGVELKTHFWWVMNNEELTDNGQYMTKEEALAEFDEIYSLNGNYGLRVGRKDDEFDEFTFDICPAPTYIELL